MSRKIVALMACVLLLMATPTAFAAVPPSGDIAEPQASSYLSAYKAYISPVGNGKIEVWFSVSGVNLMDKIGAATIVLKQSSNGTSWTTVKTFQAESYSGMLATDKMSYTSHVSYSGTAGKYYQAIVTVYAEKGSGSDSRLVTTATKKAT